MHVDTKTNLHKNLLLYKGNKDIYLTITVLVKKYLCVYLNNYGIQIKTKYLNYDFNTDVLSLDLF